MVMSGNDVCEAQKRLLFICKCFGLGSHVSHLVLKTYWLVCPLCRGLCFINTLLRSVVCVHGQTASVDISFSTVIKMGVYVY